MSDSFETLPPLTTIRYPNGKPQDVPVCMDDLPKNSDINQWRKLNRPQTLIRFLAKKELLTDNELKEAKEPTVCRTTIGALKQLISTKQKGVIIFGMKSIAHLLKLNVNGTVMCFHKLWCLPLDYLYYTFVELMNEDNDDEVYIGVGFINSEQFENYDSFILTWGTWEKNNNIQFQYLVCSGSMCPRMND